MTVTNFSFTKRTAVLIIAAAATLLALVVLVCAQPRQRVGRTEGRVAYLEALGWQADPDSEEAREILLPTDFGGVMAEYNALQLQQGFDLRRYGGLICSMYTYRVLNYPSGDENVLAALFVYRNRVIGGDIHSTALDGFMHGLK